LLTVAFAPIRKSKLDVLRKLSGLANRLSIARQSNRLIRGTRDRKGHSHRGTTMRYLLLVYSDEGTWTETERQHCLAESTELTHELNEHGQYVGAAPLQPVATATSVRVREGKRLVTDGPFAETREQLGGYFMIEAQNLDEAIEIAGRVPGARKGTVEIRPVVELTGLPNG
jgi:hypothetical protein